ncbi:hypothetical protein A2U01_0001855, partial [Trifolium medium]|nr:hypothetical protein [Trifolium medium]
VEERFGDVDVGIKKTAGSNVGAGYADWDSNSHINEGQSVVGMDEGWSEKLSDGEASVLGGETNPAISNEKPMGFDHQVGVAEIRTNALRRVCVGVSEQQVERECLLTKSIEKDGDKDCFPRVAEVDGDKTTIICEDSSESSSDTIETKETCIAGTVDKEASVETGEEVDVIPQDQKK